MRVVIPRKVRHPAVQESLGTQLRFHFPVITAVTFTEEAIEVDAAASVPLAELTQTIGRVAEAYGSLPEIPTRVIHDSAKDHSPAGLPGLAGLLSCLEEALGSAPSWVAESSPGGRGLNRYGPDRAAVLRALDTFLRRHFCAVYGAQELRVPAMLPAEILERGGYFETAHQHVSFVCPLDPSPASFHEFLPYWRQAGGPDLALKDFLGVPRDVLNPALCLHCYPLLAGAVLAGDEIAAFTLSGSCFRDESGNLNHAERLREFSMREAVFVGSGPRLADVHSELSALLAGLGSVLGFSFRIETANDIFFSDGARERLFSQLLSDNKLELTVHFGQRKPVAVASLNKHGTHFTSKFTTTMDDGHLAESMCIGFGLDRLVLMLSYAAQEQGLSTLAYAHALIAEQVTGEPK